jgi:hypothetical protein
MFDDIVAQGSFIEDITYNEDFRTVKVMVNRGGFDAIGKDTQRVQLMTIGAYAMSYQMFLEEGQKTLADKRMGEVKALLNAMSNDAKQTYSAQIEAILAAIGDITTSDYVDDSDILEIAVAALAARETQYSAFFKVADTLDEICDLLVEYQAYY